MTDTKIDEASTENTDALLARITKLSADLRRAEAELAARLALPEGWRVCASDMMAGGVTLVGTVEGGDGTDDEPVYVCVYSSMQYGVERGFFIERDGRRSVTVPVEAVLAGDRLLSERNARRVQVRK